jgi:hypothetical protein
LITGQKYVRISGHRLRDYIPIIRYPDQISNIYHIQYPSESQTVSGFRIRPAFEWSDRFIYIYRYINIHIQRSRLSRPSCFSHSKAGHKKCRRKANHSKAGNPAFGCILYIQYPVRISNIRRPDIKYPVIAQNGRSITELVWFSALDCSLDHSGMNKIFFMTLISKRVYASIQTFLSGFQMVRFSDTRDWQRIRIPTTVRFLVGHCTFSVCLIS